MKELRQGIGSASDAELVHAARRGDKRAFVEIVARHQAMVCGIALGILGDFAASEDAGQEAFLTAWRKAAEQLAAMNLTERTAARSVLETMNLPTDRRSRLLEALRRTN